MPEVTIVLAGKSGAGKTTLFDNLVNQPGQLNIWSSKSVTKTVGKASIVRNDVTMHLVDTPGPYASELVMPKGYANSINPKKVDLLALCLSISVGSDFEDNKKTMNSLNEFHGKEIWLRCLVVLTFGNVLLDNIRKTHRGASVKDIFTAKVDEFTNKFRAEVKKFNKKADPKTIFIWVHAMNEGLSHENVILCIPAGKEKNHNVLFDIGEWDDRILAEMLNTFQSTEKRNLFQQFILDASLRTLCAGATLGAIGAAVGFIGGPAGSAAGGVVGAGLGMIVERLIS